MLTTPTDLSHNRALISDPAATGPRSSALVCLYAGTRSGATADEVPERVAADGAPFLEVEPLTQWVMQALDELRDEERTGRQ
jgi:hypothetical protein